MACGFIHAAGYCIAAAFCAVFPNHRIVKFFFMQLLLPAGPVHFNYSLLPIHSFAVLLR